MSQHRVGARMAAAAQYVEDHPGCSKMAAAAAVGPNGSLNYGYRAVDRAIAAGLIKSLRTASRYELYPGSWQISARAV